MLPELYFPLKQAEHTAFPVSRRARSPFIFAPLRINNSCWNFRPQLRRNRAIPFQLFGDDCRKIAIEKKGEGKAQTCEIARWHLSLTALFPPVAMLQDIMREHIAPWDKGNKNHNHQDGLDVFCCCRVDLVGGP